MIEFAPLVIVAVWPPLMLLVEKVPVALMLKLAVLGFPVLVHAFVPPEATAVTAMEFAPLVIVNV